MLETTTDRNPIEALAEEFIERHRRGERPRLQEYTDRHPELAEQIRALFPAMLAMEDLRPVSHSVSSSDRPPIIVGRLDRIGEYRLLREVGRGGMGVVYEAEQESLGRHVAVKVLPVGARLHGDHLQRFVREAKAAARLHHTNIVPVFGVGEQDGLHYYVMQFIPGLGLDMVIGELRQLRAGGNPVVFAAPAPAQEKEVVAPPSSGIFANGLNPQGLTASYVAKSLVSGVFDSLPAVRSGNVDGPAPFSNSAPSSLFPGNSVPPSSTAKQREYWRGIARIGLQVAQALEYAHRQGVLHRDIKPSNLLLDTQGNVWVTDFGLAKAGDSENLTHTGDIVGTLRYMAPERFSGRSDARSDIYSLGLTLYELLVLRPAFAESDHHALMDQVMHLEPTRLGKMNPAIPRDLATVVHKAMAYHPDHRYQTAGGLAADLQRFLDERPTLARPLGWVERCRRWCQRNPVIAALIAALIVVFLIGFAGVAWKWREADDARAQEAGQRGRAEAAHVKADDARRKAQEMAEENHRRLVSYHVGNGNRLRQDGDMLGALLPYAEALRLDQEEPGGQDLHRVRLLHLARQAPRLRQLWYLPEGVGHAEFSPDGRLVAVASVLSWVNTKPTLAYGGNPKLAAGVAHVYDACTGEPVCPPLQHAGQVRHVTFSRDGKRLVTASDDGTARIWEVCTGKLLAEFCHDGRPIWHAEFSPDGRRVLTAGEDGTVRVWVIHRAELAYPALRHDRRVEQAAFSPNGQWLATADETQTVRLWNADTGKPASPPLPRAGRQVVFSPDSRLLATSFLHSARVWEAATGRPVTQPLEGSKGESSWHAAFSPDSRRVVVCYGNNGAQVWDIASQRPVTPRFKHAMWAWQAAFSPSGRVVATASDDRTVKVWDTTTGDCILSPLTHASGVVSVAFSPDGRSLLTVSNERVVRVWDLFGDHLPSRLFPHNGYVLGAGISRDGRRLVTASWDRTAKVWDIATGKQALPSLVHQSGVTQATFSRDGRWIVTIDAQGHVQVWDGNTGKAHGAPLELRQPATSVVFSNDGRRLVTATVDDGKDQTRQAQVWDTMTGKKVGPGLRHEGGVRVAVFSPDGRHILTGGHDRNACVWDAESGTRLVVLKHQGDVYSVSFSPDGRRILTSCADTTLDAMYAQVWNAETGQSLGPPLAHTDGVLVAAFSPDGRRIVTGGEDRLACIWDAASGRRLTPTLRHNGPVLAAEFSLDGKFVLTLDGAAWVWEAATGHLVAVIRRDAVSNIRAACFTPDSKGVITAGPGEAAKLWTLAPPTGPVEDWLRYARVHSGHRLDAFGGLVQLEGAELERDWKALGQAHAHGFLVPGMEFLRARAAAYLEAGRPDSAAADLQSALTQLPTQLSPGIIAGWWVAGPYIEDLAAHESPENQQHPLAPLGFWARLNPAAVRWHRATPDRNGRLDLSRLFGNADHISVYAVAPVYSAKQQQVTLRAGSDGQLRLWLNGELFHEYAQPRTAQRDQDKVRVTLRPGWNLILAKVTNVEGEHALYLRITAD